MNIDEIFDNPKNGANLENRVVKVLKAHWWTVHENQPYIDPNTDKQREIDIIATKEYLVWKDNRHFVDSVEPLEMRLFIDCKNLPQPLGLYVKEKHHDTMVNSFLEKRVYRNLYSNYYEMNKDIPDALRTHRYFSDSKIAYKSTNNDDKSIGIQWVNQVLHAMLSSFYASRVSYGIDYPVIVFDGIEKIGLEYPDESRSPAEKQMQYGIDYIVHNRKQYFIIDLISLDTIEDFLKIIDLEFDSLKQPIWQTLFRKSMERDDEEDEDRVSILNMRF